MTAPPAARRVPHVHSLHGVERADDYHWMRDTEAVRGHLVEERRHYEARVAHTAHLRQELVSEMAGRTPDAERSVSWRRGAFVYYTSTESGREYGALRRNKNDKSADATISVLDLNILAEATGYAELGVCEVSPCDRYLAYSVDTTGDEVYELRFRDLATGEDLPGRVPGTYYTGAWSADSRAFYYTVVDPVYRPHEVRMRVPATGEDVLILHEPDRRFELTIRATRSGLVTVTSTARDTTEVWLIDGTAAHSVAGRRPGHEYRADHDAAGGRLVVVTNDTHPEFRVVTAPLGPPPSAGERTSQAAGERTSQAAGERTSLTAGQWTPLAAPRPGERVHAADCFARHIVLTLRRAGEPLLRVIPLDGGQEFEADPGVPAGRIAHVRNEVYDTAELVVETGSYTEPTTWWSLDLDTGARRHLKTAGTPGHDPARHVSELHWVPARDGTEIPVTIARRADVPLDGTAPCLLHGYGAYEATDDQTFDTALSVLLDRGVVFAEAHIRGGGQMGRDWWLQGRYAGKPTTFHDYVDVAGWLKAGRVSKIATRGRSAGGLLQAAVYTMRPDLWSAVVAEVPFVDVVTTMLDDTIPLTVNEWEEWGNPHNPEDFTWLLAYSPYDNPPQGPRPPLLVTGAVHDPRVLVHEPAKWVARLRATGDSEVLFRVEVDEGAHTGPTGRYARHAYEAEILAFVLTHLGR
ncbi:prolyl oligopeptidase family serine peptidase [Sphaerisporangium sp. B11E5]|uniref:S9 family peptidase n=1 Tax=Sphaerisporangium sp. B11E5 TaxID=3153563 RepID=UPI00325C378F